MASYYRNTRHPETGIFQMAEWSERGNDFAVRFPDGIEYASGSRKWEFAPIKAPGAPSAFEASAQHADDMAHAAGVIVPAEVLEAASERSNGFSE